MSARRDLCAALAALPDELLARPLLNGEAFHCLKDMVLHIAAVEDGWLNEDILRRPPVIAAVPALKDTKGGPAYAAVPLSTLLDYWKAVEQSTQAYLDNLTGEELQRVVTPHDAPQDRFTVDGILSHMMFHEMRHTAQIALLLRQQGIPPPSLDLYFYLPRG